MSDVAGKVVTGSLQFPYDGNDTNPQFVPWTAGGDGSPDPPAGSNVEPRTRTTPGKSSETILVVDDEPAVLELIKGILARQGYKILVADSGSQALEICQRDGSTIDLLLTDVMMPGMSGLGLVRSLRSQSHDFPVLYMTGGTLESLSDELDPQSALLRKPFDPTSLVRSIRNFLDAARNKGGSGPPL
jgi:CheY-like chemotaxis protein